VDGALVTAFRTGALDGVEARVGRTFADAKLIAELVART